MSVTEPAISEAPQSGMKISTIVKWVVILAVLATAAYEGTQYLSYAGARETTDDAQIDGHIYPVSSMVDGRVVDVLVDNNQYVKAGTVLAHIDSRFYEAAVEKAKGDLAEAIAMEKERRVGIPIASIDTTTQVSGAEAGVTEQNARIATAQAEISAANQKLITAQARVREAQANAAKADADLARMKPLVAKEEISKLQFDALVAAAATAAASVDSATGLVKEAQEGVKVAQARLEQERAHMTEVRTRLDATKSGPQVVAARLAMAESSAALVQVKQAVLKQAEIDLDYATVKAPISGLVSQRSMEPGQSVSHGQPLVAIIPLEDVWVTANFKESQLLKMRAGQTVEVEVDAFGKTFKGHVDSIAAATGARFSLLPPENATGNFVKVVQRIPVKIVFEKDQDPEHSLRPGMSVTPSVLIK